MELLLNWTKIASNGAVLLTIATWFCYFYFACLANAAGGLKLWSLQLPLHQGCIDAVAAEELIVCSPLNNLAVRNHRNSVGALDGRESVSYHKNSPPFHQGVHCILCASTERTV
jgi:hypothetical protein